MVKLQHQMFALCTVQLGKEECIVIIHGTQTYSYWLWKCCPR